MTAAENLAHLLREFPHTTPPNAGGFLVDPSLMEETLNHFRNGYRERKASRGFRRHARLEKSKKTWRGGPVSPRVTIALRKTPIGKITAYWKSA
jgi:hypothetical protein